MGDEFMCNALMEIMEPKIKEIMEPKMEEMRKEGLREGRIQGIIEALRDLEHSDSEIKSILIKEKAKGLGKAVTKEIINCTMAISADKFLNLLNKLI